MGRVHVYKANLPASLSHERSAELLASPPGFATMFPAWDAAEARNKLASCPWNLWPPRRWANGNLCTKHPNSVSVTKTRRGPTVLKDLRRAIEHWMSHPGLVTCDLVRGSGGVECLWPEGPTEKEQKDNQELGLWVGWRISVLMEKNKTKETNKKPHKR